MSNPIMEFLFHGHEFKFHVTPTAPELVKEIFDDNYGVIAQKLEIRDDQIVLDIGANEGFFSVMVAKLYPHVRIYALEPVPNTYRMLVRNITLNNVRNVLPLNFGVALKGGKQELIVSKEFSGGSTRCCTFDPETQDKVMVDMRTMNELLTMLNIHKVRLLKIDIEGMEHEVLRSAPLDRIEMVVGEFHINKRLADQGHNIVGLAKYVEERTKLLKYESCHMAE